MTPIYVAGIAMTVFGRHPERSLHDLAGEALQGALLDAGCRAADLGVAYYSGMTNGLLQGQISIPGQVIFGKVDRGAKVMAFAIGVGNGLGNVDLKVLDHAQISVHQHAMV